MATVTAFIRVASKKKDKVNVRFRLRGGRAVQLLYVSDLTVNPDHWNPKKEEIKPKAIMHPADKAEFNKLVALRKSQIIDLYNAAPDKTLLTSEWLKTEMKKIVCPEERTLDDNGKFFQDFEHFLQVRNLSDVRTRNFRVVFRALQRFELYKRLNGKKKFCLTFDVVTPDLLHEFEAFLRQEHTFFEKDEETGKLVPKSQYKPIYDVYPEIRTPKPRGQNTINDIFTKLRTLFNWAFDLELTRNRPFRHFKVKECVYGQPIFITIDERNKVYNTDFSFDPALEKQRDVFVFQCLVGCRISDLYSMTKRSIIDGAVQYIPRKTKDGNPVVVRVPLLTATKEILDKYKDLPGDAILPLISQQKYNIAIKKILKHAGINRVVTRLNPTTGEPEHCVISDILSSHSARRAFSGNIYDKVQDPNLICPLTGHKEGSKAFNRYRKIDEDTNRKTVSLLE